MHMFVIEGLEALAEQPQHLVAGRMAVQVVHGLEAIQVDVQQPDLAPGNLRAGQLVLQMVVEAFAVGQPRQGIVHGQEMQTPDRLQPHAVVDQVARQPGAEDQQGHAHHGKGQRLDGRRIGQLVLEQQRRYAEAGRSGEVQRYRRQAEHQRGHPATAKPMREMERQRPEPYRQEDGSDHVAHVPDHQPLYAIGQHAQVMHRRDAQPEQPAAISRRQSPFAQHGDQQPRRSAEHGHQQRQRGQRRVQLDGETGSIAQHRDEVRRPDGRACRTGAQNAPAGFLYALRMLRTAIQPHGDKGAQQAQQRSHDHQPRMMQVGDTAVDLIHASLIQAPNGAIAVIAARF